MAIPVRDLKAHLSSILARARAGEIIEVTSHNKPIARIVGIPEPARHDFGALVAEGLVSWNGGKPAFPKKRWKLSQGGKTLSEMILEDRH
jgi:prevent-host-death family protein